MCHVLTKITVLSTLMYYQTRLPHTKKISSLVLSPASSILARPVWMPMTIQRSWQEVHLLQQECLKRRKNDCIEGFEHLTYEHVVASRIHLGLGISHIYTSEFTVRKLYQNIIPEVHFYCALQLSWMKKSHVLATSPVQLVCWTTCGWWVRKASPAATGSLHHRLVVLSRFPPSSFTILELLWRLFTCLSFSHLPSPLPSSTPRLDINL